MSYWLGIDVGSTFTAAAVCRMEAGRRVLPEMVTLGSRSNAVSSVVYLGADGQVLVGEAAERRAVTHPDRVAREFKRRIGDEVPMIIGGVAHAAPDIAAMVIGWVLDRVTQREGGPADGIVVTHPASWGSYKIQTLTQALRAANLPEIAFCAEPEAAAASYALAERVEPGSTIAVYDLGGGTFDAAVVRKTSTHTFTVLGQPQGLDYLGGVDFDDAIFTHIRTAVPALGDLDPEDPATLAATVALRRECTEAKEALSADTEVTIPVLAPELRAQVRLVRAEFDDMIRPQITQTIDALGHTLRLANINPGDLDTVLLVGGSSRIPLVAQLVSAELGRPVAIDTDPKAAIALGAAIVALPPEATETSTAGADVAPVPAAVGSIPAAGFAGSDPAAPDSREIPQRPSLTAIPLDVEPAQSLWSRLRSNRATQMTAAGVVAIVLGVGAALVPLFTSGSAPAAPTGAGAPAPAAPVTTTPAPNAGNSNDTSPRSAGPSGPVGPAPAGRPKNATGSGPNTGAAAVPAPQTIGNTSNSTTNSPPSQPPVTTTVAPVPTTAKDTPPPSAPPTITTTPKPPHHKSGT